MATIQSLNKSITERPYNDVLKMVMAIRENRRRRPERSMRKAKSEPAKVARAPKKTNLKQSDIFAFTRGMSAEAKIKLAEELLGGLLK